MIGNILAKIFAGSAVGYITNYLAIQMLFQEYLKIKTRRWKFSLGGVIVKERAEFESQISRLVESDVIHHRAVEAELREAPFAQALQKILQEIFTRQLPQSLAADLSLAQIPQIELSLEALKTRFAQTLDAQAPHLLPNWLAHFQLADICSEAQTRQIAHNLAQLARHLHRERPTTPYWAALLQTLGQQPLAAWVAPDVQTTLARNLKAPFQDIHNFLKYNYEYPITEQLHQMEQTFALEALIQDLAARLAPRPVQSFLREENIAFLPQQILLQLHKIFDSEVSTDIIQTLLRFLLNVLREEKSTLFDLLSSDLRHTFEAFLEKRLPDLLATLIPWIRSKKVKLEKLIEDAFRQNTNIFGQLLVALLIGNVGKYIGIEEKLIDLIEKQDVPTLARRASDFVLEFLKSHSIGEIMQRFSEQKILEALTPVLEDNIRRALQNLKLDNLENFFARPLSAWIPEKSLKEGLLRLKNLAFEALLNKGIFNEALDTYLLRELDWLGQQLQQSPPSQWLSEKRLQSVAQALEAFLQKFLEKQVDEPQGLAPRLYKGLNQFLIQYPLTELLESLAGGEGRAFESLGTGLAHFMEQGYEKIKDRPLASYLQKLSEIEGLESRLSQTIQTYLLQNLPGLMEGRIAELVRDNLARQPDTRLRDMVRKAMGEELAPLSFFGGVLGAITGGLLLGLPGSENLATNLAISGTAYGLTGWGTNWLAIRMLFKPYQGIRWPGTNRNIPFTPGVIAKHKGRFAQSMGRFIGDRLLNADNLQEAFARNQAQLHQKLAQVVSRNNYALLDELLLRYQDSLGQQLSRALLDYLQEPDVWEGQIFPALDLYAGQALPQNWRKPLENRLNTYLQSPALADLLTTTTQRWLQHQKQSSQTLGQTLLPPHGEALPRLLNQWLSQMAQNWASRLEIKQVWEWINWPQVEKYLTSFLEKDIHSLLSTESEGKLKEEVFGFLNDKIQSPEIKAQIFNFIDQRLNAEFSPEKNLKDFFGGRVMEMLEQNLNLILENILRLGIQWLKKNKEDLAEQIYQDAYRESALAWTYKNAIKNTTYTLIEEGIPDFFKKEMTSLQKEIHQKIEELGQAPLHHTKFIALDNESLKARIETILQNPKLLRKIRQLTNLLLEERIFKIPMNQLLKEDSSALLEHLRQVLHPEASGVLEHFRTHLENEASRAKAIAPIARLLAEIGQRWLGPLPWSKLLADIPEPALSQAAEALIQTLWKSPAWANIVQDYGQSLFTSLETLPLHQLVDVEIFKNDLRNAWQQSLESPSARQALEQALEEILKAGIGQINPALQNQSKDFVIEKASQAIFKGLESHILELITSLNFKQIVVREIENMHPRALEKLFYGFARRYFKYLIGYGFIFGIIFGLGIDYGIFNLIGSWLKW
ncbi:MAG: hypothetical protein OHK0053_37770 [Microscillaceae bacterium]